MAIRPFRDRRPRLLAPSRILRPPPRQTGGGREREDLVADAGAVIARGSKSLSFASRLLDRQSREKAWLLYAWCKRCRELAAGDGSEAPDGKSDAAHRIDAIRVLTRRALEDQPTADAAFDGFGQVAKEAGFTEQMADDVLEGVALDASGWRPRSEEDLLRYCYHAAAAPALMMARIMGVPDDDEATLDRAFDYAVALQLADIAREVWTDDTEERCYVPAEWTAAADIPPGEHLKPIYRERLVVLVDRMLDMAARHEAAGRFGAANLPFRQRWAALTAANLYGAMAREVRGLGKEAWYHRIRPNAVARLALAASAFREALRSPGQLEEWPQHTRGAVLLDVRMTGPVAPIPMTPLPDEEEA